MKSSSVATISVLLSRVAYWSYEPISGSPNVYLKVWLRCRPLYNKLAPFMGDIRFSAKLVLSPNAADYCGSITPWKF